MNFGTQWSSQQNFTSVEKIISVERLDTELAARRAAGERIAMTNGCFDLLHPGHVNFLCGAAEEADLLVVGVNADDTVRKLKGEGRPVMVAAERAAVIAALAVVDYVTVFHEDPADQLIEVIRPDVHCKGSDYVGGVPEQATADKVGARVALVGGPKIQNTSDILDGIRSTD